MIRRDHGTRQSTLIIVRVDTRSRSVGHFTRTCPMQNIKDVKSLERRQVAGLDEVNGLNERLGREYFLMAGLGKVMYQDIEE